MEHEELWAEIPEVPGYLVSNYGTILNIMTDEEVHQYAGRSGHMKARLRMMGAYVTVYTRFVVAGAFFMEYRNGVEVWHINGIKSDNTVLNLTLSKEKVT